MATKVTIQATIDADVEKVWESYTLPEHITKWNFATDDWQCPYAENDLRPGGTYKARMEAKDGSFGFDFEAVYDEVQPRKSLAYTMGDGRRARVDFEETGPSTKVTVAFDAEDQNDVEMQRAGWQAILNNFKKYTEAS
jgi:uncharacterized protein YndB with AHSA1/START domain